MTTDIKASLMVVRNQSRSQLEEGSCWVQAHDDTTPTTAGHLRAATAIPYTYRRYLDQEDDVYSLSISLICSIEVSPGVYEWRPVLLSREVNNPACILPMNLRPIGVTGCDSER